jgi:hypothetical protein
MVATPELLHRFSSIRVQHIAVASFDHHALLTTLTGPNNIRPKRKRRFQFKEFWVQQEGCEDIIQEAWQADFGGSTMFNLWHKLKNCHMSLLRWQQAKPVQLSKLIDQAKVMLQELEEQQPTDHEACSITRKNLVSLMHQEELYWHQRSRVAWLKNGGQQHTILPCSCLSKKK